MILLLIAVSISDEEGKIIVLWAKYIVCTMVHVFTFLHGRDFSNF